MGCDFYFMYRREKMAFELNAKGKFKDLTPSYRGSRFSDGRPKVNKNILKRMKKVTVEEAWGVLAGKGHHFQFEGNWLNLKPQHVVVGRAVTCRYVPHRPDLNDIVEPFDWSKREKAMWKWAHTTWSIEEFADPELIDSYIQRAKDKGYL